METPKKPEPKQPESLPTNEERRKAREKAADRGSGGLTGGFEREAGHELER